MPVWNEQRSCWTVKETATHFIDVVPFIYTHAIVITPKSDTGIYEDRWCYEDKEAAVRAAEAWDPDSEAEPTGWHRHPGTGRRRPEGDPAQEFINP